MLGLDDAGKVIEGRLSAGNVDGKDSRLDLVRKRLGGKRAP